MQIVNFSDTREVLLLAFSLWAIVFFRYVLVSGIFYCIFYIFFKEKYQQRKINNKKRRKPNQYYKEVFWSSCTSFIFAISGVVLLWMWQNGYTNLYMDNSHSIFISIGSLLLALVVHETYYYWLHRWMHRPKIYKWIHKVHHDSIVTSPWTSFSFHPLESILQAIFVPFIIILLPMHIGALIFFLTFMTVSATINHLDIEIYPSNFEKHWLGTWIVGATHHSLHHSKFVENYGLYFTFWDKWMKTESPEYEKLFREKTKAT